MNTEHDDNWRERLKGLESTVLYAGIDPDIDKSGLAILNPQTRKFEYIGAVKMTQIPNILCDFLASGWVRRIEVFVEAAWLLGSVNWHGTRGDRKGVSVRKGYDVGRNHQRGRDIVEMLEPYFRIVREVPPLRKCWSGRDRKITAEEFASITGHKGRTNQEARDAGIIAWVQADLPLRLKLWDIVD